MRKYLSSPVPLVVIVAIVQFVVGAVAGGSIDAKGWVAFLGILLVLSWGFLAVQLHRRGVAPLQSLSAILCDTNPDQLAAIDSLVEKLHKSRVDRLGMYAEGVRMVSLVQTVMRRSQESSTHSPAMPQPEMAPASPVVVPSPNAHRRDLNLSLGTSVVTFRETSGAYRSTTPSQLAAVGETDDASSSSSSCSHLQPSPVVQSALALRRRVNAPSPLATRPNDSALRSATNTSPPKATTIGSLSLGDMLDTDRSLDQDPDFTCDSTSVLRQRARSLASDDESDSDAAEGV